MTLQFDDLRQRGNRCLDFAAYSPRRLVLIHTAVSLGASLVVGLLNLLFSQMIATTGGLGGMGMRSMLQTAQTTLELAVTLALPFWNISLTRAALCWARGELAEPPALLEGFRRFRSVLGVKLLTGFIFLGLCMAVSYIGTMLFLFTPFAHGLMKALDPIMQNSGVLDPELLLSDEVMAQISSAAVPLMIFLGVLFAALAIPVWYRIRFADFAVMDGGRAAASLLESFRITKKRALEVFKIDLHFWWFYLLQLLTVVLCYGDTILAALGVSLPMSEEVSYVLFFAVGIVAQGLLLWWYQARVSVTYALAYEQLTADTAAVCSQTVQ
ncbi:MAG: hypothetical protein IJX01_09250 [Oscillospiraceae bacterium]|nr:hypothetical protein [Oscillospiraceae bacterium]MBQ7330069.1 hypothetical protein [Oscillospiraceae bacterium]